MALGAIGLNGLASVLRVIVSHVANAMRLAQPGVAGTAERTNTTSRDPEPRLAPHPSDRAEADSAQDMEDIELPPTGPSNTPSEDFFAHLSLTDEMQHHVPTLRDIPRCIRGPFSRILGAAFTSLAAEYRRREPRSEQLRARWVAVLMLPRMLLHPVGQWGRCGMDILEKRIAQWDAGNFQQLLDSCRRAQISRPHGRGETGEAVRKRASALIAQGQLSKAATLLTSNGVAPATAATLVQLSDPQNRPPCLTEPLPMEVTSYRADQEVQLDSQRLITNLRSSRRGLAPGPNGCRLEFLKPLVEDDATWDAFAYVCGKYAQAKVPQEIAAAMGLCNMVALNKDAPGHSQAHGASSRVRGLAVGDAVRRLVSRTLAQQFHSEFEDVTSPQQFGIAAHGGVEAAVHMLRALTDADPTATITQVDGVGAYDHIKRSCMLGALARTPTAHKLLPYVLMAYGQTSYYMWRDDDGRCHVIPQGEGGEQGDALMPALFSLGLAAALQEAQRSLQPNELVIAYLDDLYIVTLPERARAAYDTVTGIVATRCGIRPNLGKTVCWNHAGGACPPGIAELGSEVWRGAATLDARGIRLLGAPLGTPEFIRAFGAKHVAKADGLLQQILQLPDTQHAWLLLYFCLVPRFNHLLRQVPPELVRESAAAFDRLTATGLKELVQVPPHSDLPHHVWRQARLPFREGGLGLRDCTAIAPSAYWSSWVDSLPSLHTRYPAACARILTYLQMPALERHGRTECLLSLEQAHVHLVTLVPALPTCEAWSRGTRPPLPDRDVTDHEADPGEWRHGWQYYTSAAIQANSQQTLLREGSPEDAARYRSCKGSHNGRWLAAIPYNEALILRNPIFQCLLRRRLGLSVLPDAEQCEGATCRAPLDPEGHHRSACTRTGRIHGRHAAAIQPWRQVFSEAGYRVRAERLLRDTHLRTEATDQRRMDLVAAPGPRAAGARHGVPLFADVTVVSVHTQRGAARPGTPTVDGSAIRQAVAAKRRRYADVHASPQACLLVLGCETYGRWCEDAVGIIREMASLKAQDAPPLLRGCARHAWFQRWWSLIGVGVHRAIAEALLRDAGPDLQGHAHPGPTPPLADVLGAL